MNNANNHRKIVNPNQTDDFQDMNKKDLTQSIPTAFIDKLKHEKLKNMINYEK
ncbi:hypothetical protein AO376_0465 [Moraxella catarrhalis]|nr:hypothetical protein AO376_0465 [Moraxella catarrhalis]OAV20683.1 hypothetical protein AO374_0177 [Moraxella catarrhalis]